MGMSIKSGLFTAITCLLMAIPARAEQQLDLPLNVPPTFLAELAGEALGLDGEGRARLSADSCNRLELDDLNVATDSGLLELDLSMRAHSGALIMGRCTGPRPIDSRLRVSLSARVVDNGLSVRFSPERMEVVGADGHPGLLTGPSRLLADHLVLPRLESMTVSLVTAMAELDALIGEFLSARPDGLPRLAERGRISMVNMLEEGMVLNLAFLVNPAPPAVPEPTLDPEELRQWQRIEDELDGFFTVILIELARQTERREDALDLLNVLVDARWRIARALASDEDQADPVRILFLDTWQQLRPLLTDDRVSIGFDLRLAGFISGADALATLDGLGPEYGVDISRDGLRRLVRMLLEDRAPLRLTPLPLEVDPQLRALFGFAGLSPTDNNIARHEHYRHRSWLFPQAWAASPSPGEALRGLVPRLAFLDDYLSLVNRLLDYKVDARLGGGSRVPEAFLDLFDPLVRATAWKESCWRHYVGPVDEPQVIRSPVGAVGMMQIMGRVWRGVYDIGRLEAEVEYNVAAGIEILEHYMVDYALRRGEHEQPGGRDNLVRATYAAYNGGPSHLTRYRREDTAARLRAIDQAFWRDFEQMRSEQWPEVSGCYSVGD
jgi:hypothetical protein